MVHNDIAENVAWVIKLEVFTEQNLTVRVFIDLSWERQSYRHFRFHEFFGKKGHGIMPIQSTRTKSEPVFRPYLIFIERYFDFLLLSTCSTATFHLFFTKLIIIFDFIERFSFKWLFFRLTKLSWSYQKWPNLTKIVENKFRFWWKRS